MTQWFMIKDKVTGKHIPCRKGYSYSATTVELTDKEPPRLFTTRGGAKQAANCWQKGILTPKINSIDINQVFTGTSTPVLKDEEEWVYDRRMDCYEVPDRLKAQLVVVPVTVKEVSCG